MTASLPVPADALETKAVRVSGTSAPEPWLVELLGGRPTASKVAVNPRSAMSVPALARAVNLIAGAIGVMPCRVLKIEKDGETAATDHPAFPIVNRRANPFTMAGPFRAQLVRDMLLNGDGFAIVVRLGDGKPRELIHCPPGSVGVAIDPITREPLYTVTLTGGTLEVSWRDMVHVMAPSLDGVTGASPIHLGREAIGLAITLERHAARLFGNGARPGGVISIPKVLGDTAGPRMRASWEAAFGGEGSGGTAVLEDGATFNPITLSAVDAEFNASRRHQVREIANLFGVPSTMLNDLENATYSNAEALGQAFRDDCLLPIIMSIEAALERALLDEEEIPAFRITLDTDALDRADLAARSDAMAKRRAAGVTTANDERRDLNMPAHAAGDELGSPFTTANTAPAGEEPANG